MPPTTTKKQPKTPADPYAITSWGSTEIGGVMDLEVPSGQMCLVRRPGVQGLLAEGVLTDLDMFTSLVQTEVVDRNKPGAKKQPQDRKEKTKSQDELVNEIAQDPEKLASLMRTVDKVICAVVVKPEVQPAPDDQTRRKSKPGVIYTDMIDLNDKMFIFNFVVGGSRDIERFLHETESAVGDLDTGEDMEGETE